MSRGDWRCHEKKSVSRGDWRCYEKKSVSRGELEMS